MEKTFKIGNNAKYYIYLEKYINNANQQKELVEEFFKKRGIEAVKYKVSGDGFVNKPFKEDEKEDIILSIIPTTNDKHNFYKMLRKENDYGLCPLKKKSKVNKEFQDYCIETHMIINLSEPYLRDYFESLDCGSYTRSQFKYEDIWYLKVSSDYLKDNDIPEGFTEIKISEFYQMKEKFESEYK